MLSKEGSSLSCACARSCVHHIADGLGFLLPLPPRGQSSSPAPPSGLAQLRCVLITRRTRDALHLLGLGPMKPSRVPLELLQCSFWGMWLPRKRLACLRCRGREALPGCSSAVPLSRAFQPREGSHCHPSRPGHTPVRLHWLSSIAHRSQRILQASPALILTHEITRSKKGVVLRH